MGASGVNFCRQLSKKTLNVDLVVYEKNVRWLHAKTKSWESSDHSHRKLSEVPGTRINTKAVRAISQAFAINSHGM